MSSSLKTPSPDNTGTEIDSDPVLVSELPDDDAFDPQRMRIKAMDYLARREHSCDELVRKLVNKGCPQQLAAEVVAKLAAENLVSDERYVQDFINSRRNRGQGPARIRMELREKGIDESMIEAWLDPRDTQWIELLRQVRSKKFGSGPPRGYKERARQARFLQYRGFTTDQIFRVLGEEDE